jgi:pimeloyl-ACP methyl ester carboxylesterase
MRFAVLTTLLAAAFMAPSALAEPVETISVQRADDSMITAYVEHAPAPGKQSLLLILQGSECQDVAPGGAARMAFERPAGMARLDIQKYAIQAQPAGSPRGPCPPAYLAQNSVTQRVQDILLVAAWLRLHGSSWWNGRLYVMGASEGATVAAMAAPLLPETRGIVLINGSIGRPFSEGWADAMAASVKAHGGDAKAEQGARDQAKATWERARANPTARETAFGASNTLKWWDSIIDIRPSNQLLLTGAPILLMQGDRDGMTPPESARIVAEQFRKQGRDNLTYIELPGLDHGLRNADGSPGWKPVMAQVRTWLAERDSHPDTAK